MNGIFFFFGEEGKGREGKGRRDGGGELDAIFQQSFFLPINEAWMCNCSMCHTYCLYD